MANTLTFSSVKKSITSLNEITLPKFVVLTGINGSGKSHLLNAIKEGKVRSSLVNDINLDVRIFDSTSIIPRDTGVFNSAQDLSTRSDWFNTIQKHRDEALPGLQQAAIQQGVPAAYCSSIDAIKKLTVRKLREILPDASKAEDVDTYLKEQIRQHGMNISHQAYNQIGDENWRKNVQKAQQTSPEIFLTTSQSTFFQNKHFLWGEVDPFQQAFGRVFSKYRELIQDNVLLKEYPPADDPARQHLSSRKFVEEYGIPPWSFVNQILEECRLDFRVDNPPLYDKGSYEPKLTKLSSAVEMKFEDLSSGEKVLMSFALCLYNSQDNRQAKAFPKLLLLDEVDAPLHPSMVASLLNTIQNVLVRDRNVAVILATHSPSTVALAPDNTIYSMNPLGPRIEKISKNSALSLLSVGVPTLSVSFNGRRQVFVESRTDASIYESLYQRYKSYLNSERSLIFIEVGNSDESGGEKNAGCQQVLRFVEELTGGGNQSVLGLVDWDGEREPKDRVHVLSHGIRDGLESLLFDPVLLAATVAREKIAIAQQKRLLTTSESYLVMLDWDSERWQQAIDNLQNIILGASKSPRETISVEYLNGMTLNVAKEYLHLDDHELEDKIILVFGFLNPKNKHAGDLMRHVIANVLADKHTLLPKDLLDTFTKLLNNELT